MKQIEEIKLEFLKVKTVRYCNKVFIIKFNFNLRNSFVLLKYLTLAKKNQIKLRKNVEFIGFTFGLKVLKENNSGNII